MKEKVDFNIKNRLGMGKDDNLIGKTISAVIGLNIAGAAANLLKK